MMPRLGSTYPIEIEVTSKPIADYQTDEYFELDLPVAPAVMVGMKSWSRVPEFRRTNWRLPSVNI